MTRKKWLTALVAVLLIGAGIAGGFKIHETFFGGQTYSGNLNQLQEPANIRCPQYGRSAGSKKGGSRCRRDYDKSV